MIIEEYDCNDAHAIETESFFQGLSTFDPECENEGFPDFEEIEDREYEI